MKRFFRHPVTLMVAAGLFCIVQAHCAATGF